MKKILISMAAIASIFCYSCTKDQETTIHTIPDVVNNNLVTIVFANGDGTRAFFDSAAKAEAFESQINTLTIFAFDNMDKLLIRRKFTSDEIASKTATFALPKSAANTQCLFYAVVNFDASSATNRTDLLNLMDNVMSTYNGTFTEATGKSIRTGGFAMSGSITQAIGAVNTTTRIPITVKRTVAKIAVQTTIDPTFSQKYSGTLTINSVKLSRAASQTTIIGAVTPKPGAMIYTHTQTPALDAGKYNNLFYCFENGLLTVGTRVLLEINATYDIDGNASTTSDRSDTTYSIELDGKAGGEIVRNGYYRISANIKGLIGQDCQVIVSVADWETPATQQVDLGA